MPLYNEKETIAGDDELAPLAGIDRVTVARNVPLALIQMPIIGSIATVAQVVHMHLAGSGRVATIGTLAAQAPQFQRMDLPRRIEGVLIVRWVTILVQATKHHAYLAPRANTRVPLAEHNA